MLFVFTFGLLKQTRVKEFKKLAQEAIDQKQREEVLEQFNLDPQNEAKDSDNSSVQVTITDTPYSPLGRRGFIVDFNFNKSNLMSQVTEKPTIKDKSFLFGTIFIGVVITISTLIWGLL